MFIAREKLQTNIAEYVIYMYQIEDLIRAYNFNLEMIEKVLIRPQAKSDAFFNEAREWYREIIEEMKERGLDKTGHIYRVGEVLTELIYLHKTLLEVVKDSKYEALLEAAKDNIEDFREKSNLEMNHLVEICFQALYMKFLLRLKGKTIGGESEKAFDSMRVILAYLSKAYHQMKNGDMSMFEQQ